MAIRIMIASDSLGTGSGAGSPNTGSYRPSLGLKLRQAGRDPIFVGPFSDGPDTVAGLPNWSKTHAAINGYVIETNGFQTGIAALTPGRIAAYRPTDVILMIGTNDFIFWYANPDTYPIDTAIDRLGSLVDSMFTVLPKLRVYVCQIPPYNTHNADIPAKYNDLIPAMVATRVSAGKAAYVIDVNTPFLDAGELSAPAGINHSLYEQNNYLHWVAAGEEVAAKAIYNKMINVIPSEILGFSR